MKKLFSLERKSFLAVGDLSCRWYVTTPGKNQETQVFHVGVTRKEDAVVILVVVLWFALLLGWKSRGRTN